MEGEEEEEEEEDTVSIKRSQSKITFKEVWWLGGKKSEKGGG